MYAPTVLTFFRHQTSARSQNSEFLTKRVESCSLAQRSALHAEASGPLTRTIVLAENKMAILSDAKGLGFIEGVLRLPLRWFLMACLFGMILKPITSQARIQSALPGRAAAKSEPTRSTTKIRQSQALL